MKNLLTILFLFFTTLLVSQEKRKVIKGNISYKNKPVSDVHIVNKNTNIGTITNKNGFFEIPVKLGDSLLISHLNYEIDTIKISKTHILKKKILVNLIEKTNTLDEITLLEQKNIFEIYNSKEIYEGPKVTAKSLGLPFARTKPKKDKAIFKIKSGGVLSIDNLINSLNGNNRRERIARTLSLEDIQLLKIRNHYTDDFFIMDLSIRQKNINPFLNFCVKDNIIEIYKKRNLIKLTGILIKKSKVFPQKMEKDSLVLTKN